MPQFELHNAGNTEAQQKEAVAYLLAQSSTGKAATGVLSGLVVSQTTTASGSVLVAAGAGVAQAATLDGASVLVNDSPATLDVFTANPMSSLPRNDIVVFDAATTSLRVIIGTPNATPADPTVPSSAMKLARLRQIPSGSTGYGTIPTSAIDDLRTYTSVFGGRPAGVAWANLAQNGTWAGTLKGLTAPDRVTILASLSRSASLTTTTTVTSTMFTVPAGMRPPYDWPVTVSHKVTDDTRIFRVVIEAATGNAVLTIDQGTGNLSSAAPVDLAVSWPLVS